MQDFEENKGEKLEGREIRRPQTPTRAEKQHGKVYRWLDNFWYHHKWKTIISLFFVVVFTVCALQMCNREDEGDINVILAGPYAFFEDESALADLKACLALYLPEDYDGDGTKKIDAVHYSIYSEEQIKELANRVEDPVQINTSSNSANYEQYKSYLQTGSAAVLFLDPWLFAELKPHLMELGKTLDFTPAGGIAETDGEGKTVIYGVRLGDTALYRENSAVRVLPADTVICLMAPLQIGKSSEEALYQRAVAYMAALVGGSAA